MQRLIEQPSDNGELYEGSVRLGRVHYHLSVYQHFAEAEDASVPANLDVEGHVVPLDDMDLAGVHRRGSELKLRLADGRSLDCSMTDDLGRIRSTARSLYRDA